MARVTERAGMLPCETVRRSWKSRHFFRYRFQASYNKG